MLHKYYSTEDFVQLNSIFHLPTQMSQPLRSMLETCVFLMTIIGNAGKCLFLRNAFTDCLQIIVGSNP